MNNTNGFSGKCLLKCEEMDIQALDIEIYSQNIPHKRAKQGSARTQEERLPIHLILCDHQIHPNLDAQDQPFQRGAGLHPSRLTCVGSNFVSNDLI